MVIIEAGQKTLVVISQMIEEESQSLSGYPLLCQTVSVMRLGSKD
ncbi:MAG: hypothetical protein QME51_09240 [Planctomycetota bacterium]|nr:hypothetical protein [Planctomycetota bacterium]MDI6788542.1 hypothetical protein [Planctomycetota bacterium]